MAELYIYLVVLDMVPIFIIWTISAFVFLYFLKPTVNKAILQIIKIYSSSFELEAETESSGSSHRIEISGYKWLSLQVSGDCKVHFPGLVNGMLIFLVYCVWASTVAIFWDKALLASKIDECIIGDGFDCFERQSMLNSTPQNCSEFDKSVSFV